MSVIIIAFIYKVKQLKEDASKKVIPKLFLPEVVSSQMSMFSQHW